MKERILQHFDWFTTSIKYGFVFIFLMPFVASHLFHFFAPTNKFVEYWQPPIEIVSGNYVGWNAIFQSNSDYYKNINAKWWDSMFCDGIKKSTQPWEDFMSPDSPKENWEFWAYVFREDDKRCQVCGRLQVTTSRWYQKKPFEYCSPFFDILPKKEYN